MSTCSAVMSSFLVSRRISSMKSTRNGSLSACWVSSTIWAPFVASSRTTASPTPLVPPWKYSAFAQTTCAHHTYCHQSHLPVHCAIALVGHSREEELGSPEQEQPWDRLEERPQEGHGGDAIVEGRTKDIYGHGVSGSCSGSYMYECGVVQTKDDGCHMFPLDVESWWRDSRPAWGLLQSRTPTDSQGDYHLLDLTARLMNIIILTVLSPPRWQR
jgi:hypothetical protein